MQISKDLKAKYTPKENRKKDQHLHSADHVLADELTKKMNEPKRFGFYLKMATTHDHNVLRRIAGQVLESRAKKPGALFAYLVKQENLKNK